MLEGTGVQVQTPVSLKFQWVTLTVLMGGHIRVHVFYREENYVKRGKNMPVESN